MHTAELNSTLHLETYSFREKLRNELERCCDDIAKPGSWQYKGK